MSYSNKEMETLCLDLADKAEPLEASALREVAQNYRAISEPASGQYEMKYWHIVLATIAIYAVWSPLYFLAPRVSFEPPPEGRRVEQLGKFNETPDGRYTTQTYKFGPGVSSENGVRVFTYTEEQTPLVYEGRTPLPKENYEFQQLHPMNAWRFVTIRTSDGTDPSKNGRHYYVVLP